MASAVKRKNDGMRLGFILAGAFFLFDPHINVIDILPDVIGYLLINYGLSKVSDIDVKSAQTKRRMGYALAISAGEFAAMLMSFIMKFDSTLVLVFTFVFSLFKLLFILPAFMSFFESFEYIQLRFSENFRFENIENLRKMTTVFLSVQAGGALIPEFTALKSEYGYIESGGGNDFNIAVIRVMLIIICFAVSIIFGMVWLSMMIKYIRTLRRQKDFLAFLSEKYENEVACDSILMMKRSVKRFHSLLFLAMFFLICIPFDSYYVVPEFLFGIVMFFAFRFSGIYTENKKRIFVLCLSFTGVMVFAYGFLM
ncbi:MAG: hypothetical protein ACI4QR_00585, partial [Eubacteriales bacterium]